MKTFLEKKDALQFLERLPLALFDIYWIKSNGSKVKVHSMGSFISEKKISRIINSPESFDFVWKTNTGWILEGLEQFEKINELSVQRPPDLIALEQWRIDFINWASPSLWYGDVTDISYLDLVILMSIFLEIGIDDFYDGFDKLPCEIQGRNLVIASSLCFLGLVIGHCEQGYLTDLYRIFLYVDYLFSDEHWAQSDYDLIHKVNLAGLDQLSNDEKELLKESYMDSANQGQQIILNTLNYKFSAEYLKWGLEDFRGAGLELKVKMNEMSDFELIMILLLRGVSYDKNILGRAVERTIYELVVGPMNLSDRIRKVILSSVQVASERNSNFLKIAGL